MSSATELLFMGAMVRQAIQTYQTEQAPRLPKGFTWFKSFGTPKHSRLGFIAVSPKQMIIAFRGTENPKDILYGLDLTQMPFPYRSGAGTTHRGFTQLYGQLRDSLWSAVNELRSGRTLFIGGHSLGGALAALASLDLAANAKSIRLSVATFGSPRVGNETFAARYNANVPHTTRIANVNDLVPHFPPEAFGYHHVDRELAVQFEQGSNHAMSGYYQALCQAYPKACRRAAR